MIAADRAAPGVVRHRTMNDTAQAAELGCLSAVGWLSNGSRSPIVVVVPVAHHVSNNESCGTRQFRRENTMESMPW